MVRHIQLGRGRLGARDSRPPCKKKKKPHPVTQMLARGGIEMCHGGLEWKAGPMHVLGRGWEEENFLEGTLENEAYRTSSLIQFVYDVLPFPANPSQWYGEDSTCPLCPPHAHCVHLQPAWSTSRFGCKASLLKGCYTWQLGTARY